MDNQIGDSFRNTYTFDARDFLCAEETKEEALGHGFDGRAGL